MLRALLHKYEEEKRHTSQKVTAMASLIQQLQGPSSETQTRSSAPDKVYGGGKHDSNDGAG